MSEDDPSYSLIRAVREGDRATARTLIERFGLSHSPAWSSGYNLLREALQHKHEDISKLLLTSGAKVNSKSKRPSETPLHIAVKNGYKEIVSMLLARDANANARDHSNETPLKLAAAARNSLEIVAILMKHRANLECSSSNGMTALHRAALHRPEAEKLLNQGAQVNAGRGATAGKHGYTAGLHRAAAAQGANVDATARDKRTTPLHAAVEKCHGKTVKLLLERGANLAARDKNGKTALQIAVEKVHLPNVEEILKFRPDVNSEANRSSLCAAINASPRTKKLRKIVGALVNYGFDVRAEDTKDAKLLHNAVECGYEKIVESLLKLGANVDTLHSAKKGVTLLHSAVIYHQYEIARMLLSHGANVNAKDGARKFAISYAIENNDAKTSKLLLSGGGDASGGRSSFKVTPEMLRTAVKNGSCELVEVLLELAPNIDVNARDKLGRTALHHAAAFNDAISGWTVPKKSGGGERAEMARMLLSRGARVNARTKNGATALHFAAKCGCKKVVKVLLENKADVDSQANDRATPLHWAAKRNDISTVCMLLDAGANVNARQKNGTTALHTASKYGNGDVATVLIEEGADINAKERDNNLSPLHVATVNRSAVVVTLLEHGANVEAKDKLGRTALHMAADHGWRQMTAENLLDYGADINVTCNNGMTPLDYASQGTSRAADDDDDDDADDDRFVYERRFDYFDDVFVGDDNFDVYPRDDDFFSDYDHNGFYDDFAADSFADSCTDSLCDKLTKILKQHILTIMALGLYVSGKNLRAIDYLRKDWKYILERCRREVAEMKTRKIRDSNISFYDILTRNIDQLAVYAKNESIVRALETEDFHKDFPSYSRMIVGRFKRGQKRENLLSEALKSINALSGGYVLPDLSATELFNYLTNSDLENLIKADTSHRHDDSRRRRAAV